jgi:RHS repeat-associated protein
MRRRRSPSCRRCRCPPSTRRSCRRSRRSREVGGYWRRPSPHRWSRRSRGEPLEGSETRYRPYGEVRTEGAAVGGLTDHAFAGQALDANTGLMYYGARWYDPYLNRFISPDTITPDYRNPQGLNRYSYVHNNPLRYTDPSGHYPEPDEPVPPIWTTSLSPRDYLVVDMVRFSPGTDGVVDYEIAGLEVVGTLIDGVGTGLGLLGWGMEAVEIVLPPGLAQVPAAIDLILTTDASAYQGEFYYGQPHPDLPPMIVVSQDVFVTFMDLGIGSLGDVAGYLLGAPTGGVSVGGSEALDDVTSGSCLVYDLGRLTQEVATEGALGIYRDQGVYHLVFLDYVPAPDGDETIHLGQVQNFLNVFQSTPQSQDG